MFTFILYLLGADSDFLLIAILFDLWFGAIIYSIPFQLYLDRRAQAAEDRSNPEINAYTNCLARELDSLPNTVANIGNLL